MIRETTYCKRSASIFAKQGKKTKKKMNEDTPNTEKDLSQKEGKKKAKGSPKRQLIPAANYKQSVRDTFTEKESAGGDLYTMAEICRKFNYTYGRFYNLRMRYSIPCVKANATKCFPKAEVDKAMAQEAERLGSNLSEHWYSCFDIMRLFGLGKTQVRRVRAHPRGKDETHPRQPPLLPQSRLGRGTEGVGAKERKHQSQERAGQ